MSSLPEASLDKTTAAAIASSSSAAAAALAVAATYSSPSAAAVAAAAAPTSSSTPSYTFDAAALEAEASAARAAAEAERQRIVREKAREVHSRTPKIRYGSEPGGYITLGSFPTVDDGKRALEVAQLCCKYWKSLGDDKPHHSWVKAELERLGIRIAGQRGRPSSCKKRKRRRRSNDDDDNDDDDEDRQGGPDAGAKKADGEKKEEDKEGDAAETPQIVERLPPPIITYEYDVTFRSANLGLSLCELPIDENNANNGQADNNNNGKTKVVVQRVKTSTASSLGVRSMDELVAVGSTVVTGLSLGRIARLIKVDTRPTDIRFRRRGTLGKNMDFVSPATQAQQKEGQPQHNEEALSSSTSTAAATSSSSASAAPAAEASSSSAAAAPSFLPPDLDEKTLEKAEKYAQYVKATIEFEDAVAKYNSAKQRVVEVQKIRNDVKESMNLDVLEKRWDGRYDVLWVDQFRAYLDYIEEHGKRPKSADTGMGNWVAAQRKLKRNMMAGKKKKESLPKYAGRMMVLEEAGFVWEHADYKISKEMSWDDNFAELVEYKRRHGNCDVPAGSTKKNRLGRWVASQRVKYKARNLESKSRVTPLTDEQVKRLEEIGFRWRLNKKSQQPKTEEEEGEAEGMAVENTLEHSEGEYEEEGDDFGGSYV